MEIRELNLAAFGPFTERTLVFGSTACGLHIVYGPNEAGKSSALRGLKALLYGVDERTADDFIHSKDKLRVAGRVCAANGTELVFARRKGRKNTLLSPDGEPLDENALVPFLQGVSPELFETLFGIDHQALVQGGREILEQKGEVRQALFSASLGSHTLHAVLSQLDEEAGGLFRPRGSTQSINSALKVYADLKKEIKDRSLSSRDWDEHRRILARTSRELEQIRNGISGNRVELNRLQRIQRVLPKLAGRRELLQQIENLGEVVILPNDFGKRRQKADENTEALGGALRRLDEIQLAGAVPTEEELIKARTERGQVWHLMRRQWINGEDVNTEARAIDADRVLPDAFEHRMIGADELADRLRREADRVHAKASLLAEQEAAKKRAEEIEQQLDEYVAEKKQTDKEWAGLWAPCEIQPHSPREMRAWLDDLDSLRGHVGRLNTLQQQVSHLENDRSIQIQRIKQQLQSLGKDCPGSDSLETVLMQSEEVVDILEGISRQREDRNKEIKKLERDLESAVTDHQSAEKKLVEWKEQWKKLVEDFGLDGDALPSEADDFIEKLRQMFAKRGEAETLKIRIQSIDQDAETFLKEVGRIVAEIAPELAGQPVQNTVARLNTLLSDNRTRQSTREQIEEQARQARDEIQDSDVRIQAMNERFDSLCKESRCGSHAELEEAERRSTEFLRLRKEVEVLEKEILSTGEGATLVELESEAEAIDPDTLHAQIEALTNRIEEDLEPRRTALAEAKGREAKELEIMHGSDKAAALAEQAQSVLAGIRFHAERYVRLKLAEKILCDQIERYRKENQGPLLKRASDHFAVLTRGSFEGLRTDFSDKDQPVLVGIRPNQEQIQVEGMSSGTRDQLYLALRLASLEKYMERSEPMPFIVDDILVDFDDERSESALNALAALARKTQVILFTHHSRVVEQARELKTSAPVQVHEL